MKHKWTFILGSVAVFIAAGQAARAESKRIGCSAIPYVRHWLDTKAMIPRCSVEHVVDPLRTYAVYRDVTMHGRSKASIIVLYKASRGTFATGSDVDRAMLIRQQEDVSPENANLAWAFTGFLKGPPSEIEKGPDPRSFRFEAPVAALGGAQANCWAGFKDSTTASDAALAEWKTFPVYIIALTCVAKDHGEASYEDDVYKPIRNLTIK